MHKHCVNTCFTLHVVVVIVAKGLFIYAVFPVPLGEIHLGDVSEANGRETHIYSWPTIRDPKRFGRAEYWGLGTWQRQDLIGLMINTKPANGKTRCLGLTMTPFWWQLRNKNTVSGKSNSREWVASLRAQRTKGGRGERGFLIVGTCSLPQSQRSNLPSPLPSVHRARRLEVIF